MVKLLLPQGERRRDVCSSLRRTLRHPRSVPSITGNDVSPRHVRRGEPQYREYLEPSEASQILRISPRSSRQQRAVPRNAQERMYYREGKFATPWNIALPEGSTVSETPPKYTQYVNAPQSERIVRRQLAAGLGYAPAQQQEIEECFRDPSLGNPGMLSNWKYSRRFKAPRTASSFRGYKDLYQTKVKRKESDYDKLRRKVLQDLDTLQKDAFDEVRKSSERRKSENKRKQKEHRPHSRYSMHSLSSVNLNSNRPNTSDSKKSHLSSRNESNVGDDIQLDHVMSSPYLRAREHTYKASNSLFGLSSYVQKPSLRHDVTTATENSFPLITRSDALRHAYQFAPRATDAGLHGTSFRSRRVGLEVALTEALTMCEDDGMVKEHLPSEKRTALCLQMLDRLEENAHPRHRALLAALLENLRNSIYSPYFSPGNNNVENEESQKHFELEQLPYFSVLDKLRQDQSNYSDEKLRMQMYIDAIKENKKKMEEAIEKENEKIDTFKTALKEHQAETDRFLSGLDFVEKSLPGYLDDVRIFQQRNAATREELNDATSLLERSRLEVGALTQRKKELQEELNFRISLPKKCAQAERELEELKGSKTPLEEWDEQKEIIRRARYPERYNDIEEKESKEEGKTENKGEEKEEESDLEGDASAWDSEEFVIDGPTDKNGEWMEQIQKAVVNSFDYPKHGMVSKRRKSKITETLKRLESTLSYGMNNSQDSGKKKKRPNTSKKKKKDEGVERVLLLTEYISSFKERYVASRDDIEKHFKPELDKFPKKENLLWKTDLAKNYGDQYVSNECIDGALEELYDLLEKKSKADKLEDENNNTNIQKDSSLIFAHLSRPIDRKFKFGFFDK
eukprot:g1099.t1